MKKILMILMLVLSLQSMSSQELYNSGYLTIGKTFVYKNWNDFLGIEPFYSAHTFVGLDHTFHLGRALTVRQYIDPQTGQNTEAYYYEDDGTVYNVSFNGTPSPLMNFNVTKGQLLPRYQNGIFDTVYAWAKVKDVRIEHIEGMVRKVIELVDLDVDDEGVEYGGIWIEGIGSPNGYYLTLFPTNGYINQSYLYKVFDGGVCIFSYDDYFGTDHVEELPAKRKENTDATYDLNGRKIQTPQKGEIYVRDGKKFMVTE